MMVVVVMLLISKEVDCAKFWKEHRFWNLINILLLTAHHLLLPSSGMRLPDIFLLLADALCPFLSGRLRNRTTPHPLGSARAVGRGWIHRFHSDHSFLDDRDHHSHKVIRPQVGVRLTGET